MIYLALQMALYLILAALAGVGIGWWSNQLRNRSHSVETSIEEEDVFAIKNRLDTCFDDNAKLRRELKSNKNQLQKHTKDKISVENSASDSLREKIEVLMDDLQLRDDTISVLERELEVARNL
ncbi:MAG: hypothetical protein V3U78_02855 [Thiotrichaceae bacterium]